MSVAIKPLLDIAEELQSMRHSNDTELFLSSALYRSLEAWEKDFNKFPRIEAEKIYWLAFDSFHAANALTLIIKKSPDGLEKIRAAMQKLMDEFAPPETEVCFDLPTNK